MASALRVSVGQYSDRGRKELNQDFYGVSIPRQHLLRSKGIAVAIADGIGSSQVSQVASEFAVMGLLEDYYCTSDAWSVKKSVERVLTATNSWLHAKTRQSEYRFDSDRGYVCTLSALVIKSSTAHVVHVGDTRVYRLQGKALEQLTQDHRVWVSSQESHLSRALGFNPQIEIDYQALNVERGDTFLLASDGVYEHVEAEFMVNAIQQARHDLDSAARSIVTEAYQRGSDDNLTVQVVVIEELPGPEASEFHGRLSELPLPPLLEARMDFDGYKVVREIHASSRSHIYLAVDTETEALVALKIPSIDLRDDPAYLERFLTEEWVARRINSPYVVKPCPQTRQRRYLYVASEFIDGQTLSQWIIDNPRPTLDKVRTIVEQIAKGLQSFHRLEMLHQDLRPDNVMIDQTGTVKIIDFGATRVAGLAEMAAMPEENILGTAQYTAPEYFLGEAGTASSDLFSLGVITYQMLSGRLPYGPEVAKCRSLSARRKLKYESVLDDEREIPLWIDGVLRKAVHPDPLRRYESLSEFVHELRHPSSTFLGNARPPLAEQHPVLFWKCVSAVLAVVVFVMLLIRFGLP